jgi:hypothetical protein
MVIGGRANFGVDMRGGNALPPNLHSPGWRFQVSKYGEHIVTPKSVAEAKEFAIVAGYARTQQAKVPRASTWSRAKHFLHASAAR